MEWRRHVIRIRWMLAICVSLLLSPLANAAECDERQLIGQMQTASNDVTKIDGLTREHTALGYVASLSTSSEGRICNGDEIRVGHASRAFLLLNELNALIQIDEESVLVLGDSRMDIRASLAAIRADGPVDYCLKTLNRSLLWLRQGALRLFTTRAQELNVKTDYLNASIEGTEFAIGVTNDKTRVDVTQGEVAICNVNGNQLLTSGLSGESRRGAAPVFAKPEDAVQWAVHFPGLSANSEWSSLTLEALEQARRGQVQSALQLLENSETSLDLALKSMMLLTLNDRENASQLATRAVSMDDSDAIAWLALSYSQQANFQPGEALVSIQTALGTIKTASGRYSEIADFRIREVELLQVNGFHNLAFDKGREVAEDFPGVARAHSTFGFLKLYNYELVPARRSFEEAMLLDETDPLPRLGLGLSYMREGDYARAKLEMEIAVNLSPLQSMLRSYLGRVYLELGLFEQASEQFDIAMALDSNDPLPLLFDALLKQQTGNAPEALVDLHASAGRVARRGVYRSSVAQETDMAVVLASRARIYEELGFRQLTLLDGAESLQNDPGSYVGHRLLADTFLGRPRQELSRESELLQAQMRQPLSNNPSQHRLHDSRLKSFRDSGPFATSFNEFTRLFTHEGVSGRVAVLAGSNDTRGIEGQLTFLSGNSLGAISGYRSSTDGLSENRDERLGVVSGFIQHRISSRLDMQMEHRRAAFQGGDDYIGFDQQVYDKVVRNREEKTVSRVSANFRQSQARSWLLNLEHGKVTDVANGVCGGNDATRDTISGNVMDIQYTQDFSGRDMVTGVIHSRQNLVFRNMAGESSCLEERPGNERRPIRETSFYSYLYYPIYERSDSRLDTLFGLSYDRSSGRVGRSTETLNPKLGLAWKSGDTRVRAAVLRAANRSLVSSRTLEPSQVMGFAQVVDHALIDTTSLVALGVDQSFTVARVPGVDRVSIGADISRRLTEVASKSERKPESSEETFRLFAYVPVTHGSISMEWSVADWASRSAMAPDDALDRSIGLTHRLDLGVKRYWTKSLAASLVAKWRSQDGEFYNYTRQVLSKGESAFWTVDLSFEWNISRLVSGRHNAGISLSMENIFDNRFAFEDEDPLDPRVAYQRTVSVKLEAQFQ